MLRAPRKRADTPRVREYIQLLNKGHFDADPKGHLKYVEHLIEDLAYTEGTLSDRRYLDGHRRVLLAGGRRYSRPGRPTKEESARMQNVLCLEKIRELVDEADPNQ